MNVNIIIISIIFLFRVVFFFFFVCFCFLSITISLWKKKMWLAMNPPQSQFLKKERQTKWCMKVSVLTVADLQAASRCAVPAFRAVRPVIKINMSVRRWTKCIVCWCFISCSDGDPVVPLAGWRLKSVTVSKVMNLKYINVQRWPDTEDKEHSLQLAHETLPGPLSFVCV